jgi:Protein of unknown function (DUF2946)
VRTLRAWLLLLLAVLLPVRGVVAATMLCEIAESGSQMELHLQHDRMPAAHQALDQAMDATDHHSAQHEHGDAHHDHSAGGQLEKCNLCSASCSLTPLTSTGPAVPLMAAVGAAFPAVPSPALSFLSDGQERPPRSI